METAIQLKKRVYRFGGEVREGNANMKPLLGGKGANLAEMANLGIPVPPGFTVTTEVCTEYQLYGKEKVMKLLRPEVLEGVQHIEQIMGTVFGSVENPCLISVRSGARVSMPGMMDTVLNIGLNEKAVEGLAKKSGKEKFAWDSYRRFVQMYGDVVMRVNNFLNSDENPFELIMDEVKEKNGITTDQEFTVEDLKEIVKRFKAMIKEVTGNDFPDDPWTQLWEGVMAVFESWNIPRAVLYRQLNSIPEEWGTAVNVQAMVYGNMGDTSCSGVAFTRNAATGENKFNGEFLIDAQGEDVVAGVRTPLQITQKGSKEWAKFAGIDDKERKTKFPSLEEYMPVAYKELFSYQHLLEQHYKDMQDLEFTIQEGKLWMLQTRNGKRTGDAMVKIGIDMYNEGLIDENSALLRMDANKLNELLHPVFDQKAIKKANVIAKGLAASPGASTGQICFFSEEAKEWKEKGKDVLLVRIETSADDLQGMDSSDGILTARGGMTSHAAVVARGMGKCCVSGVGALHISYKKRQLEIDGKIYKEGDWLSINGSTGEVYEGKIDTVSPKLSDDFQEVMKMADHHASLKVRTNADTPDSARIAREFGAVGIGLCRTEHMFFEGVRIKAMREMIVADTEEGRRKALEKLLPMQRSDFEGIFKAMHDLPVTIRLLDPPLHEFVPNDEKHQEDLAVEMGIDVDTLKDKIAKLHELNPMLGHRGCRLGNTYPEITEMQARAIMEAALNLKDKGIRAIPEIMIPLVGETAELKMQEDIVRAEIERVFAERKQRMNYRVGTMIEVPRAALVADKIAGYAEFFSFGTNDLTQMTYGYSRDDAGKFLDIYLEKGILKDNPFETIDQEGVGKLVKMGVKLGRKARPGIKLGICGEHGGDPRSVHFCHRAGLDYVSCSPFRVPIARLAAAQASIQEWLDHHHTNRQN
ncbi:MAG: pyruvate, phosphate dikinase [Cyclobacteriaceae bacterium]|nr:pyruvate, phosphate dikinase [Cyclobacteriaceae bacterium]